MKYYYFAQAYGENNYGACNYQQNTTGCTTAGSSGATPAGSGATLTNTGLMVAVIVTAACLLALAAIVVRVWRRQKPTQIPVLQEIEENQVEQQEEDASQGPTHRD